MKIKKYTKKQFLNKVKKCNYSAPFFSFEDCETWGWCTKVYDGDTIHACFFINKELYKFRIRLADIDTYELNSKDPYEKDLALVAKNFVSKRILDKPVYLHLHNFDKYGRLLAHVYENNDDYISLNDSLLENGLANKYN